MIQPFKFDINKAIESILYIVHKKAQPTFHHISKVMYFADKDHLAKYGRFICGDIYIAMKHGPVPSAIYDILKMVRGDSIYFSSNIYEKASKAFKVCGRHVVQISREPHLEEFSDSDLECLNRAIRKYGNLSFEQLTSLSHAEAAWKVADANDIMEIEHIIATFDNADELIEHLTDPFPDEILISEN